MKKSYKTRPQDFKRRILKTNILSRKELYEEEQRWLSMIKTTEIKPTNIYPRYYNLKIQNNVWHSNDANIKTIGQKISASKKGKSTGPCSDEKARKISEAKKAAFERRRKETGHSHSEEWRTKLSLNRKGKLHTQETKTKMSLRVPWNKGLKKDKYIEE